jgi:hypothetical protein
VTKPSSLDPAKHYHARFNYAALAANCNLVLREAIRIKPLRPFAAY